MRRLILAAAAVLALAHPAHADPKGREVEAVMDEYLRLWNAHDAAAIAERIYRLPAGSRMGTREGLQASFDQLKAQGYDHSTKTALEGCLIGKDDGLVEFRFTRWKIDGTPLGPKERATLYRLRRFPDGWRIVELIGMDPKAKVSCKSVP
ncbi:unnamed protein product [Phaeothamnion confervicola]